MVSKENLSYSDAEPFRIIECFAQWEGRVNSTHLTHIFHVGRQKASEILQNYRKIAPDNLAYSESKKGYIPTAQFQPLFSEGLIDEYRQTLARSRHSPYLSLNDTGFCQLDMPLRNLNPSLIQPVIQAIREQQRLDIGYLSVSNPDYQGRIIAPHALVFDGIRWHTRAWCEKNGDYRDFVLSRFSGEFAFEGPATQGQQQDERWNTLLDLTIIPDPRLSPERRRILELDYQMQNGQRHIPVRAAMLNYLIRRLELHHYDNKPEAQQIIIEPECQKKIAPYLPK